MAEIPQHLLLLLVAGLQYLIVWMLIANRKWQIKHLRYHHHEGVSAQLFHWPVKLYTARLAVLCCAPVPPDATAFLLGLADRVACKRTFFCSSKSKGLLYWLLDFYREMCCSHLGTPCCMPQLD